jgi:HK97 family phage major capsid protein
MLLKSKKKLENIMSLQELEAQHANAIGKADAIISAVERQKRPLTSYEQQTIDTNLRIAGDLQPQIQAAKAKATRTTTRSVEDYRSQLGTPRRPANSERTHSSGEPIVSKRLSRDYFDSFHAWVSRSGGPLSAAMYEGSNAAGGYAVPIVVDDQIVPLAPQDSAIRRLSTVIPTRADIHVPQITVRAVATAKSETSSFGVASPSLGSFTLTANPIAVEVQASLEITQDVTQLRVFVLDDVDSSFLETEEPLFLTGTGSGQPQGVIGNCGAGVTEEPDSNGNLVSIQGTLDILGQLKQKYHDNATWVMQRATSLVIRKAQIGANLFEPVFRRENGVDLLHGYPVAYSAAMPTAARGNTPIVFGDWKRGYLIGDRGGSALFLKVLDQAGASQGLVDLLFYRRTDGRVRRSEALQQYNVASS